MYIPFVHFTFGDHSSKKYGCARTHAEVEIHVHLIVQVLTSSGLTLTLYVRRVLAMSRQLPTHCTLILRVSFRKYSKGANWGKVKARGIRQSEWGKELRMMLGSSDFKGATDCQGGWAKATFAHLPYSRAQYVNGNS